MRDKEYTYIVGVDEVGRGPIAGPVMIGAFCVATKHIEQVLGRVQGITDSKKLTEKKRNAYVEIIKELQQQELVQVAVSGVSAKVIDQKGIVPAINSALQSSLKKLNVDPDRVFVYLDGGLKAPSIYDQETVIKGDSKNWQIGAASVVVKVLRDKKMVQYSEKYPLYGFEHHKGYGTKKHRQAVKEFGVCDIHRKTWVKE